MHTTITSQTYRNFFFLSLSLPVRVHFFYKIFHCMQLDLLAAAQYNYMQFSKFTYLSDGESEKAAHKCIKLNTPVSKRKKTLNGNQAIVFF